MAKHWIVSGPQVQGRVEPSGDSNSHQRLTLTLTFDVALESAESASARRAIEPPRLRIAPWPREGTGVTVWLPDVVGKTDDAAVAELTDAELEPVVEHLPVLDIEAKLEGMVARYVVNSQRPDGNQWVSPGSRVYLTYEAVYKFVPTPDRNLEPICDEISCPFDHGPSLFELEFVGRRFV